MSSVPPGLPEPIPSPKQSLPPRGRDRALSSFPKDTKKNAPPPPDPGSPILGNVNTKAEAVSQTAPAFEFAANEPARAPALPFHYALPAAPPLVRNHLTAWFVMLAIVGAALAFTIPFTLGVYFGNQDREQFVESQAQEHFQRALAYESETYNDLAIAELELALQYKPDYQPARDRLTQLKTVHTASAQETPQDVSIAEQLYTSAEASIQAQDWSNGIDLFEELRRVKSDYRVSEVNAYLVTAYLAAGKQALQTNDVDLARRRFEAALAIAPNNADAQTERARALLYFNGVSLMGSNWGSSVSTLQDLYGQDPAFGDVKTKLHDAHVGYGDFASEQGAFCIAAREYDAAVSLGATSTVETKAAAANASCKNAILNPTATITPTPEGGVPTPEVSGTPNPFATPVPVLSASGILYAPGVRVRQNAACGGTGDIRGSVQDAQGHPIPNVGVKIYNDFGYLPPYARTDNAGEYEIVLGSDKGTFHLVIVDDFSSNASAVLNVDYPGGNVQGCHIVVNWKRIK